MPAAERGHLEEEAAWARACRCAAEQTAAQALDLELRDAVRQVVAAFDKDVFHVNERATTSVTYYLEQACPATRALLVLRRWALL